MKLTNTIYVTPRGKIRTLYRGKHNHCRWYDPNNLRWIGPEQSNVAPALAYAMNKGWREQQ